MTTVRTPLAEHHRFDSLCAKVEDYESLPSPIPERAKPEPQHDEDGRSEQLDEQILAGLVLPC